MPCASAGSSSRCLPLSSQVQHSQDRTDSSRRAEMTVCQSSNNLHHIIIFTCLETTRATAQTCYDPWKPPFLTPLLLSTVERFRHPFYTQFYCHACMLPLPLLPSNGCHTINSLSPCCLHTDQSCCRYCRARQKTCCLLDFCLSLHIRNSG